MKYKTGKPEKPNNFILMHSDQLPQGSKGPEQRTDLKKIKCKNRNLP
jgi:hypothetical protein